MTTGQKPPLAVIAFSVFTSISLSIWSSAADAITLQQAESIALQSDPVTAAHRAASRAMQLGSTAADTLPDPKFRLGMFNVPLDNYELDANPTTQLRLGVQQQFPAGDTLEITAQKMRLESQVSDARAQASRYQLILDLRETYLRLYQYHESAKIIRDNKILFRRLVEITEDQYAAGRASQQDVIRAELELSRLDDRYTRTLGEVDESRAALARWIGDNAWQELADGFPPLPPLPEANDIDELITRHPAIIASAMEVEAARKDIALAKQGYKPGINAFIEYRKRFGNNIDGSERDDMMAAMLTMDIPLFTDDRQDSKVSASQAQVDVARYRLDDKLRQLKQMYDTNNSRYTRSSQRETLFSNSLLTAAKNNADAARKAYQSGVTEFITLMRAQITELDVRLDALTVSVDKAIAQSKLLYITGEQP